MDVHTTTTFVLSRDDICQAIAAHVGKQKATKGAKIDPKQVTFYLGDGKGFTGDLAASIEVST